jgi:hypothetical protein
MWDYAKSLGRIGPAVNKVVETTQSGVEDVGQKLFDWLMPSASAGNTPAVPGSELAPAANDGPGLGAGDYAMWQSNYGSSW